MIGGQVKVSDLARAKVRQRGIQEIDGVAHRRSHLAERADLLEKVVDQRHLCQLDALR